MITRFIAMKNHINFRFVEVEDIAGGREYIVLRVSGRSTIAPLNGRPEELIKTDHNERENQASHKPSKAQRICCDF